MNAPRFAIFTDNATTEQLSAAHEVIKDHTEYWWHHFPNLWIVLGRSSHEWRDLLYEKLVGNSASLLVLKLPDLEARENWAFFGIEAEKRCVWLLNNLSGGGELKVLTPNLLASPKLNDP